MKITLFVVLPCLCICLVRSVTITNWGNVHARSIGTERIIVGSSWFLVKTHTFTYPRFPQNPVPIIGITHMDYKKHPVSVKFINGSIGDRNITIQIDSQRGHGINSTFVFFTY